MAIRCAITIAAADGPGGVSVVVADGPQQDVAEQLAR